MAPPRSAFKDEIINISLLGKCIATKKSNGANFCHVDRNKQHIQLDEAITEGYHIWNGAAPNLIINLSIRIVLVIYEICEVYHIKYLINSNRLDPRDCIRKYFVLASISWFDLLDIIIGIKHIILISNDSHINSQFVLVIAIKVLISITMIMVK